MNKFFLLCLASMCAASPASAQAVRRYPEAVRVVRVSVEPKGRLAFEAVARVRLRLPERSEVVLETGPDGRVLRGVASQRVGDTLCFHVPGLTPLGRRLTFWIYQGVKPRPGEIEPAPRFAARQEGPRVAVSNDYYSLLFDPADGRFFPAVGLAGQPDLDRGLYLDDRVWDRRAKDKKGHWLRRDLNAVVTLEAAGPLVAVVRIDAGYKHTTNSPAVARATYWYECRAGSPVVRVRAVVRQDKPRAWSELHFLHLSHRGDGFPCWASRDADGEGRFTGSRRAWYAHGWAALRNDSFAVGLVKPRGTMTFYDDPHGFCEYLRDWTGPWRSAERRFEGALFIGPWRGRRALAQMLASAGEVECSPLKEVDRAALLRARTPLQRWRAERPAAGLPVWPGEPPAARGGVAARRQGDWLLLRGAGAFALFQRRGALMGLADARSGRDFIRSRDVGLAWRIQTGKPGGESRWIESAEQAAPRVRLSKDGVAFTWTKVAGALTVQARWRLDASGLRGRLRVEGELPGGDGILAVRFPVIEKLGESGAMDVAIPRGNWGYLHQRFKGRQGGVYPSGNWPMQFLSVTMGRRSLYLAAEDGSAELKRFFFTAGREFYFEFVPPNLGVPGQTFAPAYDIVLQPLEGDWLAAAKRYRRWALKQTWCSKGPLARRDDIPKRFRDGLYWWLIGGSPKSVEPKLMAAKKRFAGVPMADHWYVWHQIPFDNDYPHYKPAKPGFKEAVKRLQDAGITIMPYINGRLWDSDTKDFPTVALPAACKDAAGKYYVEIYGSGEKLVPMCPFTKVWQDKMVEVTRWLFNEEGVDAIYMDQIGAARPRICMDPKHGHPLGGGGWWLEGYTKMLTRIQAMTENTPRQRFLTTENNAEPYIHLIDGFLIWTDRWPQQVPLYAAVYSDRRIAFVSQVSPADTPTAFAMKVGRDFLWGTQLGWLGEWLLDVQHREQCDYMVTLAKARLALKEFLSYGEYLGPADVECSVELTQPWVTRRGKRFDAALPAVMAARWRAANGDVGVIATNFDRVAHAVDVAVPAGWPAAAVVEDPLNPAAARPALTDGRRCRVLVPGRSVRLLRFRAGGRGRRVKLPPREIPAGARRNGETAPDVSAPQGVMLAGQPVEVLPRREARLVSLSKPLRAGETAECVIEYRLAPEDRGAVVRLVLPEGVWAQPSPVILPDPKTLAGRARVLLRADRRLRAGPVRIPVVVERVLGVVHASARDPRPVFPLSAARPVRLDGRLDDWRDAKWVTLDGKRGNHITKGKWSGPADLSGRAAARVWRGALYLAFQVTDDVHHPPQYGRQIWRGDCVQVDFDPLMDSTARLDDNDIELAAALTAQGPKLFFWTRKPRGARIAARREGKHTNYEIALPVAFVATGRSAASKPARLTSPTGFSFTFNDADQSGAFEGWLEWTPGICGKKQPDVFGVIEP